MMLNDHQKVIRGEYAPKRYSFRLINKEGNIIYVEVNFRRLKENNEVVGILAVLRDVTEKIRLEKGLLELSIGLIEFDPEYDLTTIVKRADEAMYTAKKMGGNQIFIGE